MTSQSSAWMMELYYYNNIAYWQGCPSDYCSNESPRRVTPMVTYHSSFRATQMTLTRDVVSPDEQLATTWGIYMGWSASSQYIMWIIIVWNVARGITLGVFEVNIPDTNIFILLGKEKMYRQSKWYYFKGFTVWWVIHSFLVYVSIPRCCLHMKGNLIATPPHYCKMEALLWC